MAFVSGAPLGVAPRPATAGLVAARRGAAVVTPARARRSALMMSSAPPTPSSSSSSSSSAAAAAAESSSSSSAPVRSYEGAPPGKVVLNEIQLAEQKKALNQLGDRWEAERKEVERTEKRIFGWVPGAERLNGRLAMFFFVTGLLTELWTGDTIPEQVELLARTLGFL